MRTAEMYWISTTIKKKYMEKILNGEKTMECKGATPFWEKRLDKLMMAGSVGINFLCGNKPYKFQVTGITKTRNKNGRLIDGVMYYVYYKIDIGDRIGS